VSSPNQGDKDDRRGQGLPLGWLRMYALVLEFLAYLGVLGYAGWWLDRRYGWQPWALLAGLFVGLAVGLYRLIRESKRLGF
jgi:F0F1-type ATP synthase assembly protein I